MLWKGQALTTKDDFAIAMAAVENSEEAEQFKAIFSLNFPEHGDQILGYLTGELEPALRDEVLNMFGVEHPFIKPGTNPDPGGMFLLGASLAENPPEWWKAASMIPRKGFKYITRTDVWRRKTATSSEKPDTPAQS